MLCSSPQGSIIMDKGQVINNHFNWLLKLRMCFGFYHNVFGSNLSILKYLLKIFLVIIGCVILYTGLSCKVFKYKKISHVFRGIEYVTYFTLTILTENKYLVRYYQTVVIGDTDYWKKIYIVIFKIILSYFFIMILFYIFHVSFVASIKIIECSQSFRDTVLLCVLVFANELGKLPVLMILLLLYYRIKLLCSTIRRNVLNATSIVCVKKYINMYDRSLDELKKTDGYIKPMVIFNLINFVIN